jgi:hypothetical protein
MTSAAAVLVASALNAHLQQQRHLLAGLLVLLAL